MGKEKREHARPVPLYIPFHRINSTHNMKVRQRKDKEMDEFVGHVNVPPPDICSVGGKI
jgi:hypothetical protein